MGTADHPVLLLHSSAASGAQWRALAERLGPQRSVQAPDLWGYGSTPAWPGGRGFTLADEAARLEVLFAAAGRPVHLVGHSYGGALALHLARTRPWRVRSLTLFEPVAFHLLRGGDEQDLAALYEIAAVATAVAGALTRGDRAAAAQRFVDYWNGAGCWQALSPPRQEALVDCVPKVTLDFQAVFGEPAALRALATLNLPTLLLHGEHSPAPARRVCRRLQRTLPNARLEPLEGVGHMGPLTHRERVNARIVDWLREVETIEGTAAVC